MDLSNAALTIPILHLGKPAGLAASGHVAVNFAPGDRLHQPLETGALVASLGTADALVPIDGCDVPAVTLCDGLQLAFLIAGRLAVRSAGPNVEGDPLGYFPFRGHGIAPVQQHGRCTING